MVSRLAGSQGLAVDRQNLMLTGRLRTTGEPSRTDPCTNNSHTLATRAECAEEDRK